MQEQKIILFDGVCNLCNGSVIFVLQHERHPVFKFASLQSEAGKALLHRCGLPEDFSQAVVLIDHGQLYLGSTAALQVGRQLSFPWSWLARLGFIVPQFLRDWIYDQIGRHRYQWFGRREICMVPTEDLKPRFL